MPDDEIDEKSQRRKRAKFGWWNWYANRGIVSTPPTKKELRAISWRRRK